MALNEIVSFTQPAVLFSITGRVFLSENMPDDYLDKVFKEIREDAVFVHVMKDVPKNMIKSVWEVYNGEERDVDPILAKYLCKNSRILEELKNYIDGTPSKTVTKTLTEKYFNNGYIDITPIDFLSFLEIAEEVKMEIEENIK